MQVTPDLVRPSTLAPLRHLADPLADALVAHLDLKPGQDAYTAVQQQLALDEVPEPVQAFWDDVYRYPPEGIDGRVEVEKPDGTMSDDATALEEALSRNERDGVDEKTGRKREPSLAEGQAVFWRYSGGIFTALMHFSLAGELGRPSFVVDLLVLIPPAHRWFLCAEADSNNARDWISHLCLPRRDPQGSLTPVFRSKPHSH